MKANPHRNQVLGRPIQIDKTEGGIALPDSQIKNTSVMVIVEAVGPNVTECKVGDVVIPKHMNHIYLRGGYHRVVFDEDQITVDMEGVDHLLPKDIPTQRSEAQA